MDNATYDVLNRSPNETYSTLATIPIKINNSHEANGNEDVNKQDYSKGAANKSNKTLLVVIIIMMAILLLITIVSLALSVAAYNQSKPERSAILNQQSKGDSDITAAPTQLTITCNNVSQMLFQVDTKINDLTSLLLQNTNMEPQSNCGPGLWYQVAYLNMSDPSQQCPSVWSEYTNNGIRACGRPTSSTGSCAVKCYLTSNQYSRVCGRIIGYQFKTPDAFSQYANTQIDFDGINITRGAQHDHIWSYVAGLVLSSYPSLDCPCSSDSAASPPESISDRYYCESGKQTNTFSNNQLWDGQQCEGTCCNGPGTNSSPPWFSLKLPAPTTDMIEVSICGDEDTDNENTPIELLEIYIQ